MASPNISFPLPKKHIQTATIGGGEDLISEILFHPGKYAMKKIPHGKDLVHFSFALELPADIAPFGFTG